MDKEEELTTGTLETQEVKIGSLSATGDYRRIYRFQGESVAFTKNYDGARSRDDRGTDKTLYRVGEDRYIVLIEEWSRWQGESNFSHFYSHDPEDDRPTVLSGREVYETFPDLANEAGLCFPIELDLSGED